MPDPSDTGGVDIGTYANVGGTIPLFNTAVRLASRTPEWQELGRQYQAQAGKDFNDQPFAPTIGTIGGQQAVDVGDLTAL
jgi:hypothetical protein